MNKLKTLLLSLTEGFCMENFRLYKENKKLWRDRLGIEPSGDGTRLPEGFEDLGVHQHRNRPHNRSRNVFYPLCLYYASR